MKYLIKLSNFFFETSDSIRLDTFRLLIGISLFLYMIERFRYASEWLTTSGFHISPENLPYHPFAVPLLPEELLPVFGIILFGSIIALIIGWKLKFTIWVVFVCITYVTFADQISAFTLNKLFIVSLLILALADKGTYLSIEKHKISKISIWPVRILQLTFVIQYFTAGWKKVYFGDWLTSPYTLYSQVQGFYRTDFAAFLLNTLPKESWVFMQLGSLLFELSVPILFTIKKTRRILIPLLLSYFCPYFHNYP